MKIAMVSAWDAAFAPLAAVTVPNREAYCERWGYQFVGVGDWKGDRAPQWARLDVARSVLPSVDAVFVMDLDAVVTNFEVRLDDFLGGADFKATADINGFNNGMMILMNTPWMNDFLKRLWDAGSRFGHYPNPDQSCMAYLLPCEDKTKWEILPQRTFNSFPYGEYGLDWPLGQWQEGDFILHVPALPLARRIEVLAGKMAK